MKTGYIILIIFLLVLISGVAGYFMRAPQVIEVQKPEYVKDYRLQVKIDSFYIVDSVKTKQIEVLKRKLSRFGVIPEISAKYDTIILPCDTGNVIGLLREDIKSWQQISIIQDTINAEASRFNCYLKNQLFYKDTLLNRLQNDNTVKSNTIRKKNKIIYALSGSTGLLLLILIL